MNLKSYLIALAIALVLGAWMLSGQFSGDEAGAEDAGQPAEAAVMDVQVRTIQAETVERFLENQGDTEADQDVELRAEVSGQVAEVRVAEGERVEQGEVILRLAMGDREARREEAEARVAQREANFSAAQRLMNEGYQSDIAVREARAALASARAQLAAIEEEIRHSEITAPVTATLESRPVSVGDYLRVGEVVARLLDTDPMIAIARVAQQDVRNVALGREAEIELATGDTLTGRVSYISAAAEAGSRTFRVEIEAPNPEGLPAGVSATIRIPLEPVQAHFLSPAWLSLDESGQVGVKGLDAEDTVVFHPVEIVRAERDGVWVTGLDAETRVITVGQGFVRAGERVNPVPAAEG